MFKIEGRYMETTEFTTKENTVVRQAVIYSEGDGVSYKITGVDTRGFKPLDKVEIPVSVSVYDGRLVIRAFKK